MPASLHLPDKGVDGCRAEGSGAFQRLKGEAIGEGPETGLTQTVQWMFIGRRSGFGANRTTPLPTSCRRRRRYTAAYFYL